MKAIASQSPLSALDVIYGRHSVRSFTSKRLDKATVKALLDAAVQAPTAMGRQPWVFTVVQDPLRLVRLSDRAKALWLQHPRVEIEPPDVLQLHTRFAQQLADPEFNLFHLASTLVVIGVRKVDPFTVADCWLAAENLMLAATALGLGTCCVGAAIEALNTNEGKSDAGLPKDVTAIAAIVVGEPAGDTEARPRRDPNIVAWN